MILSAAVVVSMALAVANAGAQAAPGERQVALVIESGNLADALDEWARQTGFQLFSPSWDVAKQLAAPALKGTFTPRGALEQLLRGSPLVYEITSERTVTVRARVTAVSRTTGSLERADREPLQVAALGAAEERSGRSAAGTPSTATASDSTAASRPDKSESKNIEEILVTGTNIRGGSVASAVVRIDRPAIERLGAATTQQVLERVTQNFGGGLSEDTTTSFVPGSDEANNVGFGAGVNLRGLGSDATLVLVNGHRLSATGAGNFVDVSQIPVGAIERIEVVTDGASAVYGSDAVAGVVNILLRPDYDGAETRVRYGSMADGGPEEYGVDQTFGHSWGGGNALLSYSYLDRGSLSRVDRPFAQLPIGDLLADQRRHSAIASISQNLSDRVTLVVDGLYSTRKSRFLAPETSASVEADTLSDSESDSLAANAALTVELAGNWALNIAGLYSSSKVDWGRTVIPQQSSSIETFENDLWSTQVQADGTLFTVPGGPVKLVLGGAHRRETYVDTVNHAAPRIDAARNVNSAYGGLLIPIVGAEDQFAGVNRLELSLAARYEDYSDVGSSTDPKVGLLWRANSSLSLRGTYGTSFRAPNFDQTSSFLDTVFFVDFPDSNPAGSSLALFLAGADPHIAPEESKQWTIGADFSPVSISGLTVTATYFDIEFKGRVDTPSSAIFDLLTAGDVFAPVVTRNPSADEIAAALAFSDDFQDLTTGRSPDETEVIIDNRKQNIGRTDVRGLDLSISYAFQTSNSSELQAFVGGTRLFAFENRLTPTAATNDVLDTLFNPAATRLRGGIEWSRGSWNAALSCNYSNDYVNDAVLPEERVESWTTIDASVGYQGTSSAAAFLRGLSVRLSALNLLNKDPPAVSSPTAIVLPTGYDPANANPLGRVLSLQMTKSW